MIIDKKKLKKLFESKNQSRKRNAKTSKGKKINRSLNNRPSKNLRTGSVSRRHKTAKYQKGGLGYKPSPYLLEALTKLGGGPDANIQDANSFFDQVKDVLAGPSKMQRLAEYLVPRFAGDQEGYPFFKINDYTKIGNPGGGDCLYYSLVTALQEVFSKNPLQFLQCVPGTSDRPRIPSGENAQECESAQYQIRFLLSSYIKTDQGRMIMTGIPGFRQALVSMGFQDFESRKAAAEKTPGSPALNDKIEFMFNVNGSEATLIGADSNIKVDDYSKIPMVMAVESGTRMSGEIANWSPENLKIICDTIADNILYNGGIFGKTINNPGSYEWGQIIRAPQQSQPEWGSEYHMDLFANLLQCRIFLLCPLRPLASGDTKTDQEKQYMKLESSMRPLAQVFTPLSADPQAHVELPIIYLYYSTPALMTVASETDTPSSHYEYLRVNSNTTSSQILNNDPDYNLLNRLSIITELNREKADTPDPIVSEVIDKVSKLVGGNPPPGTDRRYAEMFKSLGGKDGIEKLIKSEPVLQTNIKTYWSTRTLNEYNQDVMKFLVLLLKEQSEQAAIPQGIVDNAKEIASLRGYTEAVPGLANIRDRDYLKVLNEAKQGGNTVNQEYVVQNIESLTQALKKIVGIADTPSPAPGKKGPVPDKKGPVPDKKGPVPDKKGPDVSKKGPEPVKLEPVKPAPGKKEQGSVQSAPESSDPSVDKKKQDASVNLQKTTGEVDAGLAKTAKKSAAPSPSSKPSTKPSTTKPSTTKPKGQSIPGDAPPVPASKIQQQNIGPNVTSPDEPKSAKKNAPTTVDEVDSRLKQLKKKADSKVNLDTGEGLTYIKKPRNIPGESPLLKMDPPPEGFKQDPKDPYAYTKTVCEKLRLPKQLKGKMGNPMGLDRRPICFTEIINEMGAQQFLALLKFPSKNMAAPDAAAPDTDKPEEAPSISSPEVDSSAIDGSTIDPSTIDPSALDPSRTKSLPMTQFADTIDNRPQQYKGNLEALIKNLDKYSWANPDTVSDKRIPDESALKYLMQYSNLGIKKEAPKKEKPPNTNVKERQDKAMKAVRQRSQDIIKKQESKGKVVIDLTSEDTTAAAAPTPRSMVPGDSPKRGGGELAIVNFNKDAKLATVNKLLIDVSKKSPAIIIPQTISKGAFSRIKLQDYKEADIQSYYAGLSKDKESLEFYGTQYEPRSSSGFLYDSKNIQQVGPGMGLGVKHYLVQLDDDNKISLDKNDKGKLLDANKNEIGGQFAIGSKFMIDGNTVLIISISLPNISVKNMKPVLTNLLSLFKSELDKESSVTKIAAVVSLGNPNPKIEISGFSSVKVPGTNNLIIYSPQKEGPVEVISHSNIDNSNEILINLANK